jgi:hypothetical protein
MTNMLADRIQFQIMQAKKLDSSSHQEIVHTQGRHAHADTNSTLWFMSIGCTSQGEPHESQVTAALHSATQRDAGGRQLGPRCADMSR